MIYIPVAQKSRNRNSTVDFVAELEKSRPIRGRVRSSERMDQSETELDFVAEFSEDMSPKMMAKILMTFYSKLHEFEFDLDGLAKIDGKRIYFKVK